MKYNTISFRLCMMHVDNTTASCLNEYSSVIASDNSDGLVRIAMVIVGVLSVAGTIGNALAIYVFLSCLLYLIGFVSHFGLYKRQTSEQGTN